MFVPAKPMAEKGTKGTDSLLVVYKELESLEKEGKKEESMEYKDMENLCYISGKTFWNFDKSTTVSRTWSPKLKSWTSSVSVYIFLF